MEKDKIDYIRLGKPQLNKKDLEMLIEAYTSGYWANGPYTERLVNSFKKYVGSRYAVPVCSGTAALHLSLDCLGIGRGDEVITTTFSFPSTSHVIEYVGAATVFVDIEKDTFNIDAEKIEKAITSKTKAIIPAHIAGHPCNMDRIVEISRKYNLYIIEDAAHAVESYYSDKKIGSTGNLCCFSFDTTKNIAGGFGGMITTDNEKFEKILKLKSHFGIISKKFSQPPDTVYAGYKYDMSEFSAAIALGQLERVEENLALREHYWNSYTDSFSRLREVTVPTVKRNIRHSRHLYMILLNPDYLNCSREVFMESLESQKIGSRIRFPSLHLQKYYREKYGYKVGDFPVAEDISKRVLCIPLSAGLTGEEVEHIIKSINEIIKEFRK